MGIFDGNLSELDVILSEVAVHEADIKNGLLIDQRENCLRRLNDVSASRHVAHFGPYDSERDVDYERADEHLIRGQLQVLNANVDTDEQNNEHVDVSAGLRHRQVDTDS